ncbi:Kinesin-like protein [Spironucleus salmonicida]|uniref:Kinesin-like protein n=1 Tax=Spironucleus salmonicida TaxID=348837 RepID=V6LWD6_9EUKA|nr:Kinesin-like protein [Spironucleus salmonicida]|eukprot:EST45124.1 Kinesin-4 [Spironucleus salmonicida]
MKSNITVSVRIRPYLQNEGQISEQEIKCTDQKVQINQKVYKFDNVFPQDSTQDQVFEYVGQPILKDFYLGYSGTIFAYGQTASGKTFTLGQNGIIQNCIQHIFEQLTDSQQVNMSYYEIYNETFCDLLYQGSPQGRQQHNSQLILREADDVFVQNLNIISVNSLKQAQKLIFIGQNSRITATTQANERSSRSHAILTVYLTQFESNSKIVSKLNLVDLAGSERLKSSGVSGQQFKEMVGINSGLLALGNVISALNENKKHIPYRDSKLTRVLQDSLGGKSKCSMIACISPSVDSYDESLNTLVYASRARNIINKVVKKIEKINKPDAELIKIKEENLLLKDYIENMIFQRTEEVEQFEILKQDNLKLRQQLGYIGDDDYKQEMEYMTLSINRNIFQPYVDEEIQEIYNIIDNKIVNILQNNNYEISKCLANTQLKFLIVQALQRQKIDFSQLGDLVVYDGEAYNFISEEIQILINQIMLNDQKNSDNEDLFIQQCQQDNLQYMKYQINFDIAQKCVENTQLQVYLNLKNEGFDIEQDFNFIRNKITEQLEKIEVVDFEKSIIQEPHPEVIEVNGPSTFVTNLFSGKQLEYSRTSILDEDYTWSQVDGNSKQDDFEQDDFVVLTQTTNESVSDESSSDSLKQSTKMIKLLQEVTEKAEQMSLSQLKDYMHDRNQTGQQEPDLFNNFLVQDGNQKADNNQVYNINENDAIENTQPQKIILDRSESQSSLGVSKLDAKLQNLQHLFYDDSDTVKQQLKQLLVERGLVNKILKQETYQSVNSNFQQTPVNQLQQIRSQTDKRATGIQQFDDKETRRIPGSQRILKRKVLRSE